MIAAAARALAAGDPVGALSHVALRDDAPALALRGIAMAQLGEFVRAKDLLKTAARKFGLREAVARARCVVAQAEIALVSRDLGWPTRALDSARATLEKHGDRVNVAHARYLQVRRLLLLGRIDDAERTLVGFFSDASSLGPASRTAHELVVAAIAVRRLRTKDARAALTRAERAARSARIPALAAEVDGALVALDAPAARLMANGSDELLKLEDVEALFASNAVVVDACRRVVRHRDKVISLARRPVLFALARAMGEAWPGDATRDALIARAFGSRFTDESHRARLRVEIARLRAAIRPLADVTATARGFVFAPMRSGRSMVVVLAPTVDEGHAAVLAFLGDGESWSSSALSLALGMSQRTVQRSLDALVKSGKVQPVGRGRSRRWVAPPVMGFTTTLLLPAPLPMG